MKDIDDIIKQRTTQFLYDATVAKHPLLDIRQQAIIWAIVDQYLCCHMASPESHELGNLNGIVLSDSMEKCDKSHLFSILATRKMELWYIPTYNDIFRINFIIYIFVYLSHISSTLRINTYVK